MSRHQVPTKKSNILTVLFFSTILFVISFADALMSYVSPIFIEDQVQSTFLMGIIFAFSSFVGIICDILFPKLFTNQTHFFFLKVTVLTAIAFPLTFIFFPQHILTILFAMAIWGVYYELNTFSSFEFVHSYVHISEHAKTWGIMQAFQSGAYALAPLLATQLLLTGYIDLFTTVLFSLGIALLFTIIFRLFFMKKKHTHRTILSPVKTWITEAHIWKLLFKKVWPLLLLQLLVNTIDASFWTIGAIYMHEISQKHALGSLFLTSYIVPSVLVGLFLSKIPVTFGKKRIALISTALTGVGLSSFYFIQEIPVLLVVTFLASTFLAIAVPEIKATFEDYISRLKTSNSEMIGMQSSSASLAYVLGPIIATFLATATTIKTAFSLIGVLVLVTALYLLVITPKKIRMPQKELSEGHF